MRIVPALLVLLAASALPASAQVLTLHPDRDNTLFQSSTGALSNGAGQGLFAGATGGGQLRRALLRFPVRSSVPAGSQVVSAVLRLHGSQGQFQPQPMTLHRVTRPWGEGASEATFMGGGGGAPSEPGDATWLHTFHATEFWDAPGGDFDPAVLASAMAPAFDWAEFGPTAALTQLVRDWATHFETEDGLMVRGLESGFATAVRFDSREFADPAVRPQLVITLAPLADAGGSLPARFGLRSAGASPFRGEARIELSLPRRADVRLEVLDVRGARVRTLHEGPLEAGAHTRTWDGRDAAGHEAPAGVYLVRAAEGAGAATLRLVRVR